MASKQVKRCRTSRVIKKRLIEIRDIILLVGAGERGWKRRRAQVQAPSWPTLWLAPVHRIVGAWKYFLCARKHTAHLSAHSESPRGRHRRLHVPSLPWPCPLT